MELVKKISPRLIWRLKSEAVEAKRRDKSDNKTDVSIKGDDSISIGNTLETMGMAPEVPLQK